MIAQKSCGAHFRQMVDYIGKQTSLQGSLYRKNSKNIVKLKILIINNDITAFKADAL